MNLSSYDYWAPLISFMVTLATLIVILKSPLINLALDKPNARSLHVHPTPRIGGLCILLGVAVGWSIFPVFFSGSILGGTILLIFVSLLDDIFGLPVSWRFITHALVAFIFSGIITSTEPDILSILLIAFSIIWMTNLYNFMDGSDGLAGGMTFFGFSFYGVAAGLVGDLPFSASCFVIAGAALAFLKFNFYPAKIFLGDSGSIPLGFLAATLGLLGMRKGYWPLWFPALVFSPFIVDASVTLMRRLLHGDKIWLAHRDHYYQRLIQLGLGHKEMALYEYAMMILVGLSACWAINKNSSWQISVLVFWIIAYLVIMFCIDSKWKKFIRSTHE